MRANVLRIARRGYAENLSGRTFNRLTAIEVDRIADNGARYWLCKCECGSYRSVESHSLKAGKVKSCGCLRGDRAKKAMNGIAGARERKLGIERTILGTRVIRKPGLVQHWQETINDKASMGPSKYGRPDLFTFQWP